MITSAPRDPPARRFEFRGAKHRGTAKAAESEYIEATMRPRVIGETN